MRGVVNKVFEWEARRANDQNLTVMRAYYLHFGHFQMRTGRTISSYNFELKSHYQTTPNMV